MQQYTLEDVCESIFSGGTPSTKVKAYWSGDNRWLSSGETRNRYIFDTEKRISSEATKHSATRLAKQGDVVVATAGQGHTRAQASFLKVNTYINQSVIALRANKSIILPEYLFYNLSSRYSELRQLSDGASIRGSLSGNILKTVSIAIPSLDIQQKVIDIIKPIDEKILVNEQINKNLLEQAISIFNWFYDSSTHQQPFSSVINVFGGGTPKTSDPNFWNGDIPFFTPKDVGNPYTFKTEKYITDDGLAKCNSRLYPTNTTFVTARGTVGKVSLAGVPMAMNQSCYALVSDTLNPILVYFYTLKVVSSLKHKASGAVFDAIVTRDFDNEMINILSDTDAQQLLEVVTPMFAAIHNNDAECLRLSALRDAILPKLLSGELAFEAN